MISRVVYWNNIPAPYMVDRFNALADRKNLDFQAWFNDRIEAERSWFVDETNWRFSYRYLPATRLFGRTFHWPLPMLGKRPDVLISLYSRPSFVAGWSIARIRGVKTGFRVLKTFDRWVQRHPVKEAIKRLMFKGVDAVETPGEDGKRFAIRYGTPKERIYLATHTVDERFFRQGSVLHCTIQEQLRNELRLKGTVFIYVGRLWWGKGVGYLLEAFRIVQEKCTEEVSLLLLGDGPEVEKLRQTCTTHGIRNVIFAGFKQKPELPRYYAMADVFVFPTLGDPYGLVVDEAMACSLPVISTGAAGEIRDRIEEGVNGYIVPPEDSSILADRMLFLAKDPGLRERMGKVAARKIAGHTPEQWAKDFERIVYKLLYG